MKEILVVDDNVAICEMYRDVLEEDGYSVTAANSGREALELLDNKRFDMILLDIMMDEMNGWQLLERIRERDDCADVGIIMVTAKALLPSEVMEYGDAIQGFVMKPFFVAGLRKSRNLLLSEREELLSARGGDDSSGRDLVVEYITLRQQIRIWEILLSLVKKTFGGVQDDENYNCQAQIQEISDVIERKKARFAELEAPVKAFMT